MANVLASKKACTVNPLKMSQPIGGALAFMGVKGCMPLLHGSLSVTGTLTVHYVKPVPLERALEARAWVERRDAEKWFVSGELVLASSGALLATGTAVLIERDPVAHFGGFHDWLADQ